jgi:DNA polymerase-4
MILHADMDAFYASIEQRDDPSLRGRPVVVGGLGRRGVVCAASYEARRFGVRSALPTAEARRRCPNATFLPPRMAHYCSVAREVRDVFHRFTPSVEPLSLDEAYLDVAGSFRLFGPPLAIAEALRATVRSEVGLAVSVGGGTGKLVVKIASARAKPDGVLLVAEAETVSFLRPLPIAEIWGVGPSTEKRLHALGIATVGQLADADPRRLEPVLGNSTGSLQALARGIDTRPIESDRERRSYGEENTFAEDVVEAAIIEELLVDHSEAVARRLRRDGRRARTVTAKWRLSGPGARWGVVARSRTLDEASDDGAVISATALGLWRSEARSGAVRLIGVQVSNLEGAEAVQADLFRVSDQRRSAALNAAVDAVVDRFGPGALRRGLRSGK